SHLPSFPTRRSSDLGKTAAFGIPVVQQTDIDIQEVQTIIMCPTRELAIQVTGELIKIGKYLDGLHVVPVYGGQSISRQIKALKRSEEHTSELQSRFD